MSAFSDGLHKVPGTACLAFAWDVPISSLGVRMMRTVGSFLLF